MIAGLESWQTQWYPVSMKKAISFMLMVFCLGGTSSFALAYDYQLYKNGENFGIVVFPRSNLFPGLEEFFRSIVFEPAQTGKAVMRSGTKGDNETYMMPLEVQKKYDIKKFIVLQILDDQKLLVGIYDPEWGLTLPTTIFGLEEVKANIPKTLNIFRGTNRRRETLWKEPGERIEDPHMQKSTSPGTSRFSVFSVRRNF